MMSWLLFLLAALHVVLNCSNLPDGDCMWPHETMSSQLCGDAKADNHQTTEKITENATFFKLFFLT